MGSYNYINQAANIEVSRLCAYDSSVGYEADFSVNGDVDGWNYYDGIHTYGVWNGFLFGTLYGSSGYISRQNVFAPVPGETHYTVKISMKINPAEDSSPSSGRLMWQTISAQVWSSDKTKDFTIYGDNQWHTYILNMGEEQWWQGDINNLRLYPITNGADGDEFFIRSIKITSVSTFNCLNQTCSYHNNYSHPCQGVGQRGYCLAGTTESNFYTIISGTNDELMVNINDYGDEIIELSPVVSGAGDVIAKDITKNISKIDVGGYAEVSVTYSAQGKFKIYSGTNTDGSTVVIKDSLAARTLGFFDEDGNNVSSNSSGSDPVDGFKFQSSFRLKSFQLLGFFDNNENTSFEFDPFMYNVEGGRRDWLENGLGTVSTTYADEDHGEFLTRSYGMIDNEGKTLIDFNHPFNVSGKVKKIYVVCSQVDENGVERSNCKVKVFRPKKDGTMKTVASINMPARQGGGKLYSTMQESVVIDCDLWVNRGDILGVYNADLFAGKVIVTDEIDAAYFQISGEANGEFDPGFLKGDGSAGIFVYARSEDLQKKLVIDVDLGNRVNIENIVINGETETINLEYNVAQCLDIYWQVELFNETHDTGYWDVWNSIWVNHNHLNIAYGFSRLSDGTYSTENALAADSYTASDTTGTVVSNPKYFFVNGDEEWLGELFHIGQYKSNPYVRNFEYDPIAFNLIFPYGRSKTISKTKTFFKEKNNFRSFALSTYIGPNAENGNADDKMFMLIPDYTAVTVDALRYYEGMDLYENVDEYLFANPCRGDAAIDADNNVTNYDAYVQAAALDWTVLEHEFDPIECKGFRLYTNFHKSTKINEMEVYCTVGDIGSSMSGSMTVLFSQYEDLWVDANLSESADGSITAFIGDTPEYFNIEIEPISNIRLRDVTFDVDIEDVYVGEKGCKYEVLLDHSKTGTINQAQKIDFKNVYGKPFDFYVDIAKDESYDSELIYFSQMSNDNQIENPEVGPGGHYKKEDSYPLINQERNCAINCACYGLKNLIDGKSTYYSRDDGYTWVNYGTLSSGVALDFTSGSGSRKTVLKIQANFRTRWWKIGMTGSNTLNIREMRVLYDSDTLLTYNDNMYYDDGLPFAGGPVVDLAPHLFNGSMTGSWYQLKNNGYITIDIGMVGLIEEIVLFHDTASFSSCIFEIYVSGDNITYTKYDEIEVEYSDFYITGSSELNQVYYNYLAIDFTKRYDLQLVRNYGANPLLSCSVGYNNTAYSEQDVFDVNDVVFENLVYGSEQNVEVCPTASNDDGFEHSGSHFYNMLEYCMSGNGWVGTNYADANSFIRFKNVLIPQGAYIKEAFIRLVSRYSDVSDTCNLRFYGEDVNNASSTITSTADFESRTKTSAYANWSSMAHWSAWNTYDSPDIKSIIKEIVDRSGWSAGNSMHIFLMDNNSNDGAYRRFCTIDQGTYTPELHVVYREYDTDYGNYRDARWMRVALSSTSSSYIRKLGVYPRITSYIAPSGEYNHEWDYLGSYVTNYSVGTNLALNATVSGSSNFGTLYLGKITDGIIGNTLTEVWGSDSSSTQWVKICFDGPHDIYRIKIYHGYNEDDADYLIKDYTIQASDDDVSYTTLFTITGNTDFERTHDLDESIRARFVKINITDYDSKAIYLPKEEDYEWFEGAVLREVEINEDYGFSVVSSEEYPIICTNLAEQFYVDGHSLVGIDTEDTSTDWSNADSNFCYSDSVLSDPKKISFGSWGGVPDYEQWVVVKRDTATNYNSGPDYLKHVKIESATKPNPCEYSWWWNSYISTLSNDYNYTKNTFRSLKIEYPASTDVDIVSLIEGDNFGVDSNVAWRDGLMFWLYIDNVANLDTSYGYFYFGNANEAPNVEYRWDLTTLSGALNTGWNALFLRPKSADTIEYTELNDIEASDPRILSEVTLKTIGLKFKGTGNPLTMCIDGFDIIRNTFYDYSKFSQGLYLAGRDYLGCPIGEFDCSRGTIEFWLRPDYGPYGSDYFKQFKFRTLFHFTNVVNDVFGAVVGFNGIGIYYGNISEGVSMFYVDAPYWEIDDLFHIAIVFSSDGLSISTDRSTIRLYIYGELVSKTTDTWEVSDNKYFKFILGGKNLSAIKDAFPYSSLDGVVSNLKIYNYCKTDFEDSLNNYEQILPKTMDKPSNFIEISKDNVTFLKVGDTKLPFEYKGVAPDHAASVYVRSCIPDNLTGKENRTSSIIANWFVTV